MKTTKFKPSEVGPIPEEWEVKPICDIAPLQRGFDLPSSKLRDGNVPVVYSNGIGAYHDTGMCVAPALVTGRSGTIGKFTYIREGAYWPHNTALWVTSFCGNSPLYVKYLFETLDFEAFSTGTGVPTLNRNSVHDHKVALPPRPEQEKIAEALSDVDALLAAMTKLIEKKRAIKQGAMQQLLTGKKRLAGFSGKWVEKRLGEIADFMTATTPTADIDLKWYIGTENMLADKAGVIQNAAAVPYKAVREYIKGDVLTSNIRPYLRKIWFADRDGGCSTDVLVIRTRDRSVCISEFLVMLISDDAFFDFAMANAVGTKMPRGDKKVLVNFEVKLPTIAEQQSIAAVLSDMDAEIAALEAKRAKYESIKQGMMQELLTGKVRLV